MSHLIKTLVAILTFVYLLLALSGRIGKDSRLGWPELALIVFVVLLVAGIFENLKTFKFGDTGFQVELIDIKREQNTQRSDLTAVRIALRGLVTKYEYHHLERLNADGSYQLRYGNKLFEEISRLDDIGYIQPTKTNLRGFVLVQEQFSTKTSELFNLKDYMQITDEGKAYLDAREKVF